MGEPGSASRSFLQSVKDLVATELELTRVEEEQRQAKVKRRPKGAEPETRTTPDPVSLVKSEVKLKGPPSRFDKRARREFERKKTRRISRRRKGR